MASLRCAATSCFARDSRVPQMMPSSRIGAASGLARDQPSAFFTSLPLLSSRKPRLYTLPPATSEMISPTASTSSLGRSGWSARRSSARATVVGVAASAGIEIQSSETSGGTWSRSIAGILITGVRWEPDALWSLKILSTVSGSAIPAASYSLRHSSAAA